MNIKRVAVIGVGNIGIGAMTDLVLHGIEAVGIDVTEGALRRAEEAIMRNVRFAPAISKSVPKLPKTRVQELMTLSTDLTRAASCEFIIENVTENWEVKKSLYERLDAIVPEGVCFGVNTSCISITQVGAVTRRPQDIIGIHLMNPVYMKPTVEVIRGFHTAARTLETLRTLFRQLGKQAILVEDLPGFVSNRISHLFMNEAVFVLQDQVATAEQIDAIFKQCFGHTMGPLETADLIGLDTVMRSLDVLYESYHDSKYRCCPLLRKLVHAGHLGRKSGKGFYNYPEI